MAMAMHVLRILVAVYGGFVWSMDAVVVGLAGDGAYHSETYNLTAA